MQNISYLLGMISHPFIVSESSLLCSQMPDMGLCSQPEDATP